MTYGPTIFFAKLSLFLLYLRIFSPSIRTKYAIYIGVLSCFVVYAASTIFCGYQCIPRPRQTWLSALMKKSCHDAKYTGYVVGVFNIASDFYLLILPLPSIWKLQMPLPKKIGICGVFIMGLM